MKLTATTTASMTVTSQPVCARRITENLEKIRARICTLHDDVVRYFFGRYMLAGFASVLSTCSSSILSLGTAHCPLNSPSTHVASTYSATASYSVLLRIKRDSNPHAHTDDGFRDRCNTILPSIQCGRTDISTSAHTLGDNRRGEHPLLYRCSSNRSLIRYSSHTYQRLDHRSLSSCWNLGVRRSPLRQGDK